MTEKLHIVLGNEFVTFKGVHYVAKSGCGEDEGGPRSVEDVLIDSSVSCEPTTPIVPRHPSDIVYVNRQCSAVNAGLVTAEAEVRNRLRAVFPGNKGVGVICTDQFALRDLVKDGCFHQLFGPRFSQAVGAPLGECVMLIEEITIQLKEILSQVRLHVQLDHSGNVKDYLEPRVYEQLIKEFAALQSHTGFKTALITPKLLARGINLAETLPLVRSPFEVPLSDTCFSPSDVSVIFERVIRDYLKRIAVACDWDETINENPATNRPFYEQEEGDNLRNAINFEGIERKPVVACVGVVAGVPSLIAHQSNGGVVRMFMERDRNRRRVDRRIIEAGLNFYEQIVAKVEVLSPDADYLEMKMPRPVRSELFMTFTGAEQVQDSGVDR